MQLSRSTAAASDPTLAGIPGTNDLVLVWSDSRNGAGELYVRSRVGGIWSRERRLTDLAGDSRYPSSGVDGAGRLHLAWLYSQGTTLQVKFMCLGYSSPIPGTPIDVTAPTDFPSPPVVAVAVDGRSSILWSDRASAPAKVWVATFLPATGLGAKKKLVGSNSEQLAVDAAMDAADVLHVVWQESATGVNQIHYQRRLPDGSTPVPLDTVLVSRGEAVQNPTLRLDAQGGRHLAFVGIRAGVQQVRYMHWSGDGGWDCSSTELTATSDGSAARPAVVATSPDEVSVLYVGSIAGSLQQVERQRIPFVRPLAVPDPIASAWAPGLRIGPNPLLAGTSLQLRAGIEPGSRSTLVEFFDVTGRRVASVPLVAQGPEASGELPGASSRGWRSGVYFARLRGSAAHASRLVVVR